tara:strand:+ start:114 stop:911 length:798 start_codon:yes stop_codon:yes gene_type:complete
MLNKIILKLFLLFFVSSNIFADVSFLVDDFDSILGNRYSLSYEAMYKKQVIYYNGENDYVPIDKRETESLENYFDIILKQKNGFQLKNTVSVMTDHVMSEQSKTYFKSYNIQILKKVYATSDRKGIAYMTASPLERNFITDEIGIKTHSLKTFLIGLNDRYYSDPISLSSTIFLQKSRNIKEDDYSIPSYNLLGLQQLLYFSPSMGSKMFLGFNFSHLKSEIIDQRILDYIVGYGFTFDSYQLTTMLNINALENYAVLRLNLYFF